ncbi:hypothetical protein ABKV19_002597 [Rosa sericea]
MGVEDLGFEKVQGPVGTVTEGENSAKENGKLEEGSGHNEPIKFGSHGDEMAKKEGNGVAVQNFPQDAVDEWPAPKQIHSFYFVRYRTYDDPKLKAKIEQANVEVQKKNQARSRVLEALNAKRAEKRWIETISLHARVPLVLQAPYNPFVLVSAGTEDELGQT